MHRRTSHRRIPDWQRECIDNKYRWTLPWAVCGVVLLMSVCLCRLPDIIRHLTAREAEFALAAAPEGMQLNPQTLLVTVDQQAKIRFGDFELIAPIESYNLSPRGFDLKWQQNLTKGLQAELQSHRDVGSIIIDVPPNANLQLIAVIAAGLQSKAKVRCFLRIER
jgi:hypothetical protein